MRFPVVARIVIPALVVVLLDRLLKAWILRNFAPPDGNIEADLVGTVLRIEYVENTGVAFGMLGGGNALMAWLMPAVILLLGLMVREQVKHSWLTALGAGLVLGGATGNFIDRLRYGFVVDFIAVGPWPRFNIADAAITCGVVLVLWSLLKPNPPATPASEAQT